MSKKWEKYLDGWIRVFRTGTHESSDGKKLTWTKRDLDQIVDTFNPTIHEIPLLDRRGKTRDVPVVVGHPEDDSPAWAWVSAIRRVGEYLEVKYRDIDRAFAKAVAKGRYRKRSISVDSKGRLIHVGYLGGALPAVEGMSDLSKKYKQKKGGKFAVFTPQKPKKKEGKMSKADRQRIDELERDLKKRDDELKEVKTEFSQYKEGIEKQNKKAANQQIRDRVDDLVERGKISKDDKKSILSYAMGLSKNTEAVDIDGNKQTMLAHYFDALEKEDGDSKEKDPLLFNFSKGKVKKKEETEIDEASYSLKGAGERMAKMAGADLEK